MSAATTSYLELEDSSHTPPEDGMETSSNLRENGRLLTVSAKALDNESLFARGSRRIDNNRRWTIVQLLNYMIGSGILNSPQIFSKSGVAAATVMYLIVGLSAWTGQGCLIFAAEAMSMVSPALDGSGGGVGGEGTGDGDGYPGSGSGAAIEELEYGAVAMRALGPSGGVIVDGFITLQNFGACCSYVVLMSGLVISVMEEWLDPEAVGGFGRLWFNFYFLSAFILVFLVLPPCLIRHFSNLRWLSMFSLLAVWGVLILVAFGGPVMSARERATSGHDPGLDAPIRWWDWGGMFTKLGSVVFTLTCSPALLHSYSSMAVRREREWQIVIAWVMVGGVLLCAVNGLVGYLSFRDTVEGDVLDNFTGVVASCLKGLVVVHLVLYIPNEIVILRHSFFALLGYDVMDLGFRSVAAVTVGVLGALLAVVMGLMAGGLAEGELFGYVLDFTGGIGSSMVTIALPTLIYLRATRGMNAPGVIWRRRACRLAGVVGVFAMIAVPTSVVLSAAGAV